MRLLVKGGNVYDPATGTSRRADVYCEAGRIATVADSFEGEADRVVDASGCFVTPGYLDLHAHVGEPGHEARERLDTLAQAAVSGGFTGVLVMPNTDPVRQYAADCRRLIERSHGLPCRLYPAAALTKGRDGAEPTEWGELAEAGVRALGDCKPLTDPGLIRRALTYLRLWDVPLLLDCVDRSLSAAATAREGYHATVFGLRGMPAEAEELAVMQAVILARLTGGRVHLQRVTTKRAVEWLERAKGEGLQVSAEVSWLHLLHTGAALDTYNTAFKVWPPFGDEADRQALLDGVRSGVIDAIVSDHTPYALEEKRVEFDFAPFGAAGLETAVAALWTRLVDTGVLEADVLAHRLTAGPAQVLGLPAPSVAEGEPADLTIFDPSLRWQVTFAHLASLAVNQPYIGSELQGGVRSTIVGGAVQYERAE